MKRKTCSYSNLHSGAVLVLLALLTAGCGGGASGDSPADDPTNEQSNDNDKRVEASEKPGPKCPDPRRIFRNGQDTGVDACSNGVIHRAEAKPFDNPVPRADASCIGDPNGPNPNPPNCVTDSDCPGALEACVAAPAAPSYFCACQATCRSDADCDDAFVCDGTGELPVCVRANCRTSDDCDFGLCAQPDDNTDCGGDPAYFCHTPDDECLLGSGRDCLSCFFQEDKRVCYTWIC